MKDFLKKALTKASDERGMTLVEILAVIVLITMIMVVVGKNVIGQGESAKANLNVVKMEKVKQLLGQYRLQYNTYPNSLDDLVRPSSEVKKSGKLFSALATEDELKDVWGFPYEYKTENNKRSYSLKSFGSDGVPGGEGGKQDFTLTP